MHAEAHNVAHILVHRINTRACCCNCPTFAPNSLQVLLIGQEAYYAFGQSFGIRFGDGPAVVAWNTASW